MSVLANYKFENFDGNLFEYCNKKGINFDVFKKTAEVLEFNSSELHNWINKKENKSEKTSEYEFIVKNDTVGNDCVVHKRRIINQNEDSEEYYVLLIK